MTTSQSGFWIQRGVVLVLFLNAIWILTIPSFPTLDGWTHLHTARMLFAGLPDGVYCHNPGMVPNRVGHLLLGVLQLALPGLIAERILLALIIFGVGIGTYALTRAFGGRSPLVLLVLPFTVGFLLVMGFHNFLLGLGGALLLSAWWITRERPTWLSWFLLTGASLLLLYTHTMGLVLFLLITGAHELYGLFGKADGALETSPKARRQRLALFLVACAPAILLFLVFNASRSSSWGQVDRAGNLGELFNLRSMRLLLGPEEGKFNYAMKLTLVVSLLITMITRTGRERPWRLLHRDIPLVLSLALLVLYFIVPDSSGYASFITMRLQLMALILLVVWIASQPMPGMLALAPTVMVLLLQNARLQFFHHELAPLAAPRDLLLDAAEALPAGAVVLPISNEGNWLLGHAASLLAVQRNVVLLDNYECGTGYFPLVWCPSLPAPLHAHFASAEHSLEWLPAYIEGNTIPKIDHIVLFGYDQKTGSCAATDLQIELACYYKPGYANAYVQIYDLIR